MITNGVDNLLTRYELVKVEAPLLLLLVTHSSVGSTFGAHSCMAKSLKNLF